ncbi:IclR family transcriptional regulator [Zobellella endophytica]|uniref:IclR family transcriptional regulator n=1 Tax=Zobellella endophytica TaxID=2116700 RepID=A0A2P7RB29_9GAMM|nr:IclR family transcriptional regulator [Zobellella endophytica]PSJ47383.1 IclR family transcriptional regulator [Zobellella endophytica]
MQTPPPSARPQSLGPQTLARAMTLLRIVAESGYRGATVDDFLCQTELSRTTVYRLLQGLRQEGFLRSGQERGRYYLGYELLVLGSKAGNGSGLRELARPCLLRLAEQLGDSFFLFIRDGYYAICLEVQHGRYPVASFARSIGGRMPLGVGQASIALLADLNTAECAHILEHNAPRLAREYAIDTRAILAEIEHLRTQGFARGVESSGLPEYTGLALPIIDHSGHPMGALSCSMLKSRKTPQHQEQIIGAMKNEIATMVQQARGLISLEE